MAWIYFVEGKLKESKTYFEQIRTWLAALMNLGHIALIENRNEEARALYQESLEEWEDKEAFFVDMESDYQYLKKHGNIERKTYDEILTKLRNVS